MFEIKDKSELTIKEVSFLLVSFLRKKGLLEEFYEERCLYHDGVICGTPKEAINKLCYAAWHGHYELNNLLEYTECSFLWKNTRKGYAFWRDISNEWRKYINGKYFTESSN